MSESDVRPLRVVVLGAGFGGLELTTRLSEKLGHDVDVVLVDRTADFVFGFSKLDVMFGRLEADQVRHPYADIVRPGVRFVRGEVVSIDPESRRVETSSGDFEADVLVLALGADLDPGATPGMLEDGIDFYTESGAFAAREVLERFEGGRVVVAVASTPYKCPPAPSETVLLVHEYLTVRGVRDRSQITLVLPLPSAVPPSPVASAALAEAFAERGIELRTNATVRRLVPARHVAVLDDDSEIPYDLFLGVPVHRVPDVDQVQRRQAEQQQPGQPGGEWLGEQRLECGFERRAGSCGGGGVGGVCHWKRDAGQHRESVDALRRDRAAADLRAGQPSRRHVARVDPG